MIVGIDPGKSGAIAAIGEKSHAEKIPLSGKEIDGALIARLLSELNPDVVILEKVGAMPGQGVTSMFSFGKGFGIVIGVLEALSIPYRIVTPQAWKKCVLAGTSKDKDAAINFVRRAYPDVELVPARCRKPHDGIADAVCLAEYGRQLLIKGEAA
ncbi:hypothetical protein LMG33818_000025 [Halomonadaceae bacterium LMG 33818]|uniref:hypothetical protein n=1 Tax=Cernens ardua TaxID=3402176 RepID=UPI003EDC0333